MKSLILRGGAALLLGAVLGAVAGWLWWQWFAPVREGIIADTEVYGPMWYPDPFDPGFGDSFTSTAQFVFIGAVAGVVLGVVGGLLARGQELAMLLLVSIATGVGLGLMVLLGQAQQPADAASPMPFTDDPLVTKANVCTIEDIDRCPRHPAAIEVNGWTPYLAWPAGTLAAFVVVMLAGSTRDELQPGAYDPAERLRPTFGG